MVSIARKNLVRDPWRLGISVGGVSFAILLMLFLHGTYVGQLAQASAYIDNAGADVWIAQDGITDLFHSQSVLAGGLEDVLVDVPGVERASPILGRAVHVGSVAEGTDLFLVAYDVGTGIGGPWKMHAGSSDLQSGGIIVDRVFASNQGYGIGDEVAILNATFTITGISRDASTLFNSFAFIGLDDGARLAQATNIVNYYLLDLEPGTTLDDVAPAIQELVAGATLWTKQGFSDNNARGSREAFLPIIASIMVLGLTVGVVVVGLTIYTATMERRAEFGVLKAMGAPNRQINGIVMQQSIVASTLGFVLGVALTFGVEALVEWLVPEIRIDITLPGVFLVLLAALLMSLLAAVLPMRRLAALDPAEVFRV